MFEWACSGGEVIPSLYRLCGAVSYIIFFFFFRGSSTFPNESNALCLCCIFRFDVQSPQLTIRETVGFSAKLRLDEGDPAVTDESTERFVEQTLAMLELTNIQDLQVGTDDTGGLSFEQKKRLSIAVELVANPSIIFLDEP